VNQTIQHTARILKTITAAFLMAAMMVSCKNDMTTISAITPDEGQPTETARNIEVLYSDSGRIIIQLTAPLLKRFADEEAYMEFPEGLQLNFFDSLMNVKTTLTAQYGISWEKTKIMEVKNDVVVNDFEKDEILNTEHLIWDQREQRIYSEVFVKRTTPDGVLYGDGFDADENLSEYILRNPRGVFTIEEDGPDPL
jgi:LPS export ABC transporter protein LptC